MRLNILQCSEQSSRRSNHLPQNVHSGETEKSWSVQTYFYHLMLNFWLFLLPGCSISSVQIFFVTPMFLLLYIIWKSIKTLFSFWLWMPIYLKMWISISLPMEWFGLEWNHWSWLIKWAVCVLYFPPPHSIISTRCRIILTFRTRLLVLV